VCPAGVITRILLCGILDRKRTHFTVLAVHVSVTTSAVFYVKANIVEVILYPIRLAIVLTSIIFFGSFAGTNDCYVVANWKDVFIREFKGGYLQSRCSQNCE